jgi:hypothetical protein
MKRLVAIASLLLAGSVMASPWFLMNGDFKGKGVWKDTDGVTGTYESSLSLRENDKTRSTYGELLLARSTRIFKGDHLIHEERGTYAWTFTGWGRFLVLNGDQKVVGEGKCALQTCSYTYKDGKECGHESLAFRPKKGFIKVNGGWADENSRGSYGGYLCQQCTKQPDAK